MRPVSRTNSRNQYAPFFLGESSIAAPGFRRNGEFLPDCFDSHAFPVSLRVMSKSLRPLLLLVILATLPGCSLFHKKSSSSAHLYEGDAPTLRFNSKPETAGGRINPY
jgi:hypothetical protein